MNTKPEALVYLKRILVSMMIYDDGDRDSKENLFQIVADHCTTTIDIRVWPLP